jgi:hypothetical protein
MSLLERERRRVTTEIDEDSRIREYAATRVKTERVEFIDVIHDCLRPEKTLPTSTWAGDTSIDNRYCCTLMLDSSSSVA